MHSCTAVARTSSQG